MEKHLKSKFRSIVDEYNKNHNSFDSIIGGYSGESLYPIIAFGNCSEKWNFVELNKKFTFSNDTLKTNFGLKSELPHTYCYMFMSGYNPFFYTYRSDDSTYLVRIYSETAKSIFVDFLIHCSDFSSYCVDLNKYDVLGLLDIVCIDSKTNKKIFPESKEESLFENIIYSDSNKLGINFNLRKIINLNHSVVSGYSPLKIRSQRLFICSLIYHILKKSNICKELISLQELNEILIDKSRYDYLLKIIEDNYDCFDDLTKNACFFFSSKYKYISDKNRTNTYLDNKMCALANEVTHHFDYEILNFPLFNRKNWRNKTFNDFVISVAKSLCEIKDKIRWYNHTGTNRMIYLKSLLFLNWCYYPNKVVKSATAIWLYYILRNNLSSSFSKDRIFYKTILAFLLQENDLTFLRILDECSSCGDEDTVLQKNDIFNSIIAYYSNAYQFNINDYTYHQKKLLSRNIKKSLNWDLYSKRVPKDIDTIAFAQMGERYADDIFDYIKNMLEDSNYTNQVIVNLVDSMSDYRIPYNYSYSSHNNYSSYGPNYEGSYVRDTLGWTKDEIDTILDGNPDAYWNID